jgi:tetratricopeptide (TPR) repeat protein
VFRVVAIAFCLSRAFAQSPQQLMKEAVEAQQAGRFEQAIHNYRLLLDKYPNIAEIHSNLGAALAGEGRYADAIAEYERALKIKPNPQVSLNLGLAYYKTGQLARAVTTLNKLHREQPNNLQALIVLADCHLQLGENKQVIQLMTPAQKADPENATFNYMLGTALVRDEQTVQGQIIIDKILRNGDSAQARLLMGTTKLMVNDFKGALDDFTKAVELDPKLPDVYSYYGLALLATGDQGGAKKAFQRELQTNPNNFDANLQLGVLLRQDEDNEAALKFFQHALEIRPGDYGVRYQIATVELAKGQLEQAQRDLEMLVKEAPRFTEAHVSLATIYFRQKKKAEGERERAIVAKLNAEKQANSPAVKAAQ